MSSTAAVGAESWKRSDFVKCLVCVCGSLARLYTRYFGGDTKVVNLEGYGCDVYVTLPRNGDVLENIHV